MSEKKAKEIKIPVYDVEKQMEFIVSVCKDFDFEPTRLIPLIFADWIYTFQLGCSKMNGKAYETFIAYLKSTKNTYDNLIKIKEFIKNGNKQ